MMRISQILMSLSYTKMLHISSVYSSYVPLTFQWQECM